MSNENQTVHKAEIREIILYYRNQAERCADEERGPIHGTEYANGVSAGLEHAADELEARIDE